MVWKALILEGSQGTRSRVKEAVRAARLGQWEFHEAADPNEGHRMRLVASPDIVFAAQKLPRGSGADWIREFLESDADRGTPVVVIAESRLWGAITSGATPPGVSGVIKPPFRTDDVRRVLARVLPVDTSASHGEPYAASAADASTRWKLG